VAGKTSVLASIFLLNLCAWANGQTMQRIRNVQTAGGGRQVHNAQPAQDAQQIASQAVRTELCADAADHTLWIYYDQDRKPDSSVKQWVAETRAGTLNRVLERDGQSLDEAAQQNGMNSFIGDSSAQAKQRKADRHDDGQATEMLSMLPTAFIWSTVSTQGGRTLLHFTPNTSFHPPTWESRVFAAMEGEMTVDDAQHRIVSLKGRLIHDVKFGGGFFGELKAGGTFDVERRETGSGEWQITQTHVHIDGHALLFKSIAEDEDEEKSNFEQLPENTSFTEAEQRLLQARQLTANAH
jgi:hypothetical protein